MGLGGIRVYYPRGIAFAKKGVASSPSVSYLRFLGTPRTHGGALRFGKGSRVYALLRKSPYFLISSYYWDGQSCSDFFLGRYAPSSAAATATARPRSGPTPTFYLLDEPTSIACIACTHTHMKGPRLRVLRGADTLLGIFWLLRTCMFMRDSSTRMYARRFSLTSLCYGPLSAFAWLPHALGS